MNKTLLSTSLAVVIIMTGFPAHAVSPTADELYLAHAWTSARFSGRMEPVPERHGLIVLANHDPVQKNARNGRPMNIAGKQYAHGLYCHAVSNLVVRLPGPATSLHAVVGVDTNEQTSGGRGSVVFSVKVKNTEKFKSGVMREGMEGIPVSVDLDGASEFVLEVGDAGDGISCDQSDWANADVKMADGRIIRLGDLSIVEDEMRSISTEPPFSFVYDGKPSLEFLSSWDIRRTFEKLDSVRIQHANIWTDPKTGLQVRLVGIEYRDFPTVEWTVYLENTGTADTPIIEKIQPLDVILTRNAEGEFTLNHNVGSPCLAIDYRPLKDTLGPNASTRIATSGGRSTNSDLPYFNIEWPGEGVIAVMGWPGQWAAEFSRDAGSNLRVSGGQELTQLRLLPGEKIRTPLVVLQFWQGDRVRSQNIWRRWMLEHNTPHPDGKYPPAHFAACSSHQFHEMENANEENQKHFVDRYLDERLKLDYWWMDAGWYPNVGGWPNTGTWEVDKKRFPNGLRAITDHARARGVKSIVWFEPERVTPGTWLYDNHPEWLLGKDGEQKLLNLGHPQACEWLVEHLDDFIREQGVNLFRSDYNIDPLPYWRANDSQDRQGITEIRYVEGFLAYWDELRRRHPGMLIDTCASGGRRNDIETLRRAVPLLRSDYILEPIGQQNHTFGIASWIPLYGTGLNHFDDYGFRSCMCPFINTCYDMRNRDADWDAARRLTEEWRSITPYYYGDYYPLTPYSPDDDVWMAWQFDRPNLGEGVVQAFRRHNSLYEAARLKLRGLDADADYTVSVNDRTNTVTGRELMETGLLVMLPNQPDSAAIVYRRVQE